MEKTRLTFTVIFILIILLCSMNTNAQVEPHSFLKKAEDILYHPDENGLRSLKFVVQRNLPPTRYPEGGKIWEVNVEWHNNGEEKFTGNVSNDAPFSLQQKQQLKSVLPVIGETLLSEQLNRYVTRLLNFTKVSYQGENAGLHKIAFKPKESRYDFKEKVLFYDENYVLQRAKTIMGNGNILMESYNWEKCLEQKGKLILDVITAKTKFQGFDVKRKTKFNYDKIKGIYFITSQTISTEGIPGMPSSEEKMVLHSFVVNGNKLDRY